MSSINPYYTFQYSQPEEYHFSHDSVFLARQVFEFYRGKSLSQTTVLDLCAGCGVIGLDFIFHCQKELGEVPAKVDFLEVQEIYREHFQKNVQTLAATDSELRFLNRNYNQVQDLQGIYDLILCNPPYFDPAQGTLSPSEFKNRCRFFLDSDFASLLHSIRVLLKPGGQAYMLLRNLSDHGKDTVAEARELLGGDMSLEILENIRGTGLVRISK